MRYTQVGRNLLIAVGDVFTSATRGDHGVFLVKVSLNLFPGRGNMGEAGCDYLAVVDDYGNLHKVGV